jgi:hypothetical protein
MGGKRTLTLVCDRGLMFTSVLIGGFLASALGAFLAYRNRQRRWLVITLPFLVIPLALYAVIAFACIFGNNCP